LKCGWAALLLAVYWTGALLAGGGCTQTPGAADRRVERGNSYFQAQEYEKAEQAYTEALQLDPGQPGQRPDDAGRR
jgi:Tfp pilus assembly protein PilF